MRTSSLLRWVLPAAAALAVAATLRAAIALSPVADLAFGRIVSGPSPGTVGVSPVGARTFSGGCAAGGSGSYGPAEFSVTGTPSLAYSVVLPPSATLSAAAASMTADGFSADNGGAGVLDSGGRAVLRVGATLHVGASQSGGAYSGSFLVVVSAN